MFNGTELEDRTSWSPRLSAPGPRKVWARPTQRWATISATCTTR